MKLPRLMNVALVVDNSPQTAFRNALRSICDSYLEYSWCQERAKGADTSSDILRINREFVPDVTFMQLQDYTVLAPQDAAAMVGITIVWNGDVRNETQQWMYDLGKVVDLSLFTNMRDVNNLKAVGINSDYLQIGFDETLYTPNGSHGDWPEILFLGSNFGDSFPLSQLRRDMVERLIERFGSRFLVAGHGWAGPSTSGLLLEQQEAEALRSTKIVVNLSHYNLERYSSDRLLRALGCGALVLSHSYDGIEKDWKDGEHLVAWNSLDDLCDKIEWVLRSQILADDIRLKGCYLAHHRDTWQHRIQNELLPKIRDLGIME